MRALVTGGGGFIGSHIVERLLRDGHDVVVLDSFSTGRRENLTSLGDVELIEGDVQSYERVHNATRRCDVVLHQAALPSVPRSIQDPLMTNVINVTGTLNVLLAARDSGVRRVIYASSSSVYGSGGPLPKAEMLSPAPISPYAVSKLAGEGYCRTFADVYGLECMSLRYFNVFGPRQDPRSQYASVIPNFIAAVLEGRRPVVFGDGSQSRDFTYVDNVVEANMLALEAAAASGQVLNVACGDRVTLNDLLRELGQIMGYPIEPEYRPARKGDVSHSHADITRASEVLGYRPVVAFSRGLELAVEHLAQERTAAASSLR
jgi:nucleoside-diphosphate-sugar epimerase